MTVELRPHHLLCMLTYAGAGYGEAFCAGYDALIRRIAGGEPIRLVDGPDDVCRPISNDPAAHCHRPSVRQRDARAAAALSAELGRPIAAGAVVEPKPELIARLRDAFAKGRIRAACAGCDWAPLCDAIAGEAYARARLPATGGSGAARPQPRPRNPVATT